MIYRLTRECLLLFFMLMLYHAGQGQEMKLLILEKIGSRHRITYTVGDQIILRMKGEDFEIRDRITDISDSVLFLSDFFIPVSRIHYVKTVHAKGLLSPSNGPKLMIAGVALFAIDVFNQMVIQGDSYRLSNGVVIASASLIGAGGLLMAFKYRKFKPGKNKRIRTFVM